MPQVPTTPAVLWTSAHDDVEYVKIRGFVEREVFGEAASSTFRTDIDILGDDTFFDYTNLCKWWVYSDPDFVGPAITEDLNPETTQDIPPVFNEYFKVLWISKAMRRFRSPEKGDLYWKGHAGPLFERIATHFESLTAFNRLNDTQGSTSVNTLRRYIIAISARQRSPVIPPFSVVTTMIRDEYVKLWKEKRWNWKIRLKQFEIQTSGDLLLADIGGETDSDIIDGIASKHLVIHSSTGTGTLRGRSTIQWLDSERFAQARVFYHNSTGTPRYFYDEDRVSENSVMTIHLLPAPDRLYTAFAMFVLGPRPFTTDDNSTEPFDPLPEPFRAHLRDRLVARILHQWGREDNDATRHLALVKADTEALTGAWEDRGAHRYTARGHHHMKYVTGRASFRGNSIIGQLD